MTEGDDGAASAGNVIRFPLARPHDFRRDGDLDPSHPDATAWAVCAYLRNLERCLGCPASEDRRGEPFTRMCRLMAEEVISICRTGNPRAGRPQRPSKDGAEAPRGDGAGWPPRPPSAGPR